MIYRVVLDDTIDIHTSNIDCMLLNPSIELEMNSAGSFTFTLPPTHPKWDDIKILKSTIDVYENNELIFTGRVASIEKNWNNERVVECEGALAYFNDSIHRQMKWETPLPIASEDPTVHNFLKDILDNHNVFEGSENLNRHIYVGHIYVDTELVTREVDYDTTLDILTRMCIDTNGGYFQIRKDPEDGKLYLDWLKDFTDESSQPASFGLNLLNFNTSLSAEDICTGVLARGATVNDQVVTLNDVELVDETTYPDMSVDHYTDRYQDILWHREGVENFGQVVQVHDFSDAQTAWKDQHGQVVANSLFEVARKWLEEKNTKVETIEVEVAELAWLGDGYPQYKLGQIVEVIDSVHMGGESQATRRLPMYKLSCDLTSGSKKVTLGTPPKKELTQISASNSDSSTLSSTSSSGSSGGSGSGEECKVHDVRVDGTSVVSNKIANISLTGKADVSTVNALAVTVANKADASAVTALANVVSGKQDQIEFNTAEAATEVLTRLKADNVVYNLGGGTEVVANPSETATDDLETIKIGNTVYDIPGSGGSSTNYGKFTCDVLFDTPTRSTGWSDTVTICSKSVLDEYDAIYLVNGYNASDNSNRQESTFVLKRDIELMNDESRGYQYMLATTDAGNSFFVFGLRITNNNLVWYCDRNGGYFYKVYGLKFENQRIYLPALYSEEEREVGVWTDGKPVYQKTFIYNNSEISNNSWCTKDITGFIETVDNIVCQKSMIKYRLSNGKYADMSLGIGDNYRSLLYIYRDYKQMQFYFNMPDYSSDNYNKLFVTLQYTKTTDQPGSGTWTPEGQLAHHYSTSEKIVGTWIDGSTVYERTITGFSVTLRSGNAVDTGVDISYVSKLISVNALGNDDISVLPVAGYKINNTLQMLGYQTGNIINCAVIQYTKST